jgi:hypothetical protein
MDEIGNPSLSRQNSNLTKVFWYGDANGHWVMANLRRASCSSLAGLTLEPTGGFGFGYGSTRECETPTVSTPVDGGLNAWC